MEIRHVDFIDNKPIKNHSFYEPEDVNKYGFKFFQVSAFIGPMHSGKSLAIINLVKYLEDNNLTSEVFLLSPTIENNPFHVLDIPQDNIFYDLNNVQDDLQKIINYMKSKIQRWKQIKENMTKKQYNNRYEDVLKIYNKNLKKNNKKKYINVIFEDNNDDDDELLDEDFEMLEDNKLLDEPFYYKNGPVFTIILDDILGSQVISNKKSNVLNKLIANHRHLRCNIYMAIQTFTNGIPKSLRRIIKQYYLWKFNDLGEIEHFYKEIGSAYFKSFDYFEEIYREVTNKPHTFLLLDSDPIKSEYTIRENFNSIIKLKYR
jgi:hypothetical protein